MAAVEKTPRDFGSGDLLYRSEVHTLKAIGENAGANITALARYAGTSKSAVSQMVDRLVRRDLVEKYRNPENDKDILLRLTHRGRIAFLGHEQYHLKIHARVEQRLKEMTTEEFRSLQEIFRTIEETVDESLADRG
ncbi:MAG TPA: MarR family transcriptional regulator [Methanoregula sp.]|nr:MarR family transcriptional regulator [Methanoregula sp.]